MYSCGLRIESKAPSDVMIGTLSSGFGGDMTVCVRTVRRMHLLGSCSATFSNYWLLFPILPLLRSAFALK